MARLLKISAFFVLLILLWLSAISYLRNDMRDPLRTADAIIVLGCRVRPDGSPSNALAARTYMATHLFREKLAKNIVFTGGQGDFGEPEARVASELAKRTLALPDDAIHLEEESTSTTENAAQVASWKKFDSVIIVTNDYHQFRAKRVFSRYFDHVQVATIHTPNSALFKPASRELLAIGYYWLAGRL